MLTLSDTSPASNKVTAEPGIDDVEAAHSPLGPSSSGRWINCPGSVLLSKDVPDTESSYAIEGTAAHILSEHARMRDDKQCSEFLGRFIRVQHQTDDKHTDVEVTQEMVDAVQKFVDYCEDLPGAAFYEVRVNYDVWVPGGFGTGDDIRIDNGLVHVTDLKYGKGVQVWAEDNSQLKLYALGVYQEYSHLYDMKRFVLTIHQPRLDHVDIWEVDAKALLRWAKDVAKPAAEVALKPGGKLSAGEHCRFCPIADRCKTRAKWVFNQTVGSFDNLDDVEPVVTEFMDLRELGHCLDATKAIRQWCGDVEARGLSLLQAGTPPVGKDGDYKLVPGRGSRFFKSAEAAEKLLRKKLKVAQIFTKKMISPAQAEKILGKKPATALLGEQIESTEGKPVMVPATDKRAPVTVNADDVFENLDEEES